MKEKFLKRFVFFGTFMAMLFVVLAVGLVNLQIRASEDYGERADSKKTKVITTRGDRGMITDVDSKILAYDKKIYNVCFYRDPRWDPTKEAENDRFVKYALEDGAGSGEVGTTLSALGMYTQSILDIIEVVERYGGETLNNFALKQSDDPQYADTDGWFFDWGDITVEQGNAREKMWRDNFYVANTASNPDRYPTSTIFQRLCDTYKIPADLPLETKSKVLAVWQEMQMNAFLSKPVVIARDVSWETVIEIETRSMTLDGISIAVDTERVYPNGMHMAHVIGYIGKIQNQDTYDNELRGKGYALDDLIGLDGIEKSMEDWLTPNSSLRQGRRIVEIDRYGAVSRELENTPPQNGNNVKLTIDSALQGIAEDAIEETVNEIHTIQVDQMNNPTWLDQQRENLESNDRDFNENPIKLAETGALIVIDMEGRVKALASYPPYDPNAFIAGGDYVSDILNDDRRPLMNYAIQSLATPGSIFKMVTASAGMASQNPETGLPLLDPNERISDGGKYDVYDKTNPPSCWIGENQLAQHADQTIVEGMKNSCNYFFYTVADRVGSDRLYQFAALYGLTSKTGIDLPGERQSYVGNQKMLYDPAKAISAAEQATWRPYLVAASLKTHLTRVGRERNITFDEANLDRTVKRLMDMAVAQPQDTWVRGIRAVLMEELDMSRELVYLQAVVGDIFISLNEVKWGGNETIMCGIGQSITQVSPAAVARYVAAVANGGKVYDLTLIDSITTPEGVVVSQRQPVLATEIAEVAPYLKYIQEGMFGVVDDGGTAEAKFRGFKYLQQMAAKTGTAEVSTIDLENNAWLVAYAPFENPEIAVVVYVPNGYGGAHAATGIKRVIEYYLDNRNQSTTELMPPANSLAF